MATIEFSVGKSVATNWITFTTVMLENILIIQTKTTADFATLAIFAGFEGIFSLRKRKTKRKNLFFSVLC